MMALITLVLGLAGLFGFMLGMYLFGYRFNLTGGGRWFGAIIGGLVMGAVMIAAVTMILWPPFSLLFTFVVLALVGIGAAFILVSKKKTTEYGTGVIEELDASEASRGRTESAGTGVH